MKVDYVSLKSLAATAGGRRILVDLKVSQMGGGKYRVSLSSPEYGIRGHILDHNILSEIPAHFFGVDWSPIVPIVLSEPVVLESVFNVGKSK